MSTDDILVGYRVDIDDYGIDARTLTDSGLTVGQLQPIGHCALTPGEPSPVGRTEEGDLAYVVLETEDHVRLTRAQAAYLLHLAVRDLGPTPSEDGANLLRLLEDTAVPHVLFAPRPSAHEALAFKARVPETPEATLERARAEGITPFGVPFRR